MDQNQQNDQGSSTPSQPAAQPQAVQHQYVIQEKSLKGIGGALIFWLVVFTLFAIGYLYTFAAGLTGEGSTGENVVTLLFTPILAIGFTASVVLIALQKKLAVLVTLVTLGVHALYTAVTTIISYTSSSIGAAESLPLLIVTIIAGVLITGLVGLYFIVSKRVKQTLVG